MGAVCALYAYAIYLYGQTIEIKKKNEIFKLSHLIAHTRYITCKHCTMQMPQYAFRLWTVWNCMHFRTENKHSRLDSISNLNLNTGNRSDLSNNYFYVFFIWFTLFLFSIESRESTGEHYGLMDCKHTLCISTSLKHHRKKHETLAHSWRIYSKLSKGTSIIINLIYRQLFVTIELDTQI